jgi:regulator of protease activity HflC (stomatin/prohibitin superfamily)
MKKERVVEANSGWIFLVLVLLLYAGAVLSFVLAGVREEPSLAIWGGLSLLAAILQSPGFFVVNPNQARVLTLFGSYRGSVKQNGFFWTNPFMKKQLVSLRARNLNGERLKVNDLSGNPIEIAAVVVWQVDDPVEALFEVDDYAHYVTTQSESAVRTLASAYHYDGRDDEVTLRGSTAEVSERLQRELQERLGRAGVHVIEARISHLAYAPEIAHAMLQRQQAAAVVAARTKIVEGAVGMVDMALKELDKTGAVKLDEERKAAMVSNLLTVLCSERTAPVINAGTLYPG